MLEKLEADGVINSPFSSIMAHSGRPLPEEAASLWSGMSVGCGEDDDMLPLVDSQQQLG
jgi:hypothetical protein